MTGPEGSSAPPLWREISAPQRWDELVLPTRSRELIEDVAQQARAPTAGARRNSAVMALFSGERGTGKTMAAQVLATTLRAPLIEIDAVAASLSGVAALAATVWRALRDGAPHRAVIVLDDVGALLGPGPAHRAGETDAIDLTARCVDYPGVVIFCSRIALRLTAAEHKRLTAIVPFPMPEAPARAQIWRQSLPASAALTEADVDSLALTFRLSGGAIHACCLSAQRAADNAGHAVTRADVAHALELAYRNWVLGPATRRALTDLRADQSRRARDDGARNETPTAPTAPEQRRGPSLPWRRRER